MDQDDDHMEGKGDKSGGMDLGALERDLLEYQFSEDDDGEVDGNLLLMTPSSFMSPTKEAPASLSPVDPISLAMDTGVEAYRNCSMNHRGRGELKRP